MSAVVARRLLSAPSLSSQLFSGAVRTIHESNPQRTGALAIKAGMITEWDKWGNHQELTVLLIDNCQVTQVKDDEHNGYSALQLGVSDAKVKNVTKPLRMHFQKAGVAPKRKLWEFRVKPEALLPVGTTISSGHFVPGQLVDVTGITKGKGFQGGMKRHGFAGLRASHGVSVSHRSIGSTGQCQDPGRVFKGKKMPGHMGVDRVTKLNLLVYKIDLERNLVYVKGHVPGHNGNFVRIRDAIKGPKFPSPPPFPTYELPEDLEEKILYADLGDVDPNTPVDFDD